MSLVISVSLHLHLCLVSSLSLSSSSLLTCISGSPETTQRHCSGYSHRSASASDAPLNYKRGGTAAWQRGISTSWVPRHTHRHFPSHRSLEKNSLSKPSRNLSSASPFPMTTCCHHPKRASDPIHKVNHVELCRRVALSEVQMANSLPGCWDSGSIPFTSHKIIRNQSSSSPVGPLRLRIFLWFLVLAGTVPNPAVAPAWPPWFLGLAESSQVFC